MGEEKKNFLVSFLEDAFDPKKKFFNSEKEFSVEGRRRCDNNNLFSQNGDKVLNRYTDSFVSELREKLDLSFPCSIYGGSTFMEYQEKLNLEKLDFPVILVLDDSEFVDKAVSFQLSTASGEPKEFLYDVGAMPIKYGVSIVVLEEDQSQYNQIEDIIRRYYTEAHSIMIPVSQNRYQGMCNSVVFCLDAAKQITHSSFSGVDNALITGGSGASRNGNIRVSIIPFVKTDTVYFYEPYTEEEIEGNQRLQYRMIQQAEFCVNRTKALFDAGYVITVWKDLMAEKKRGLLGSVLNTLANEAFYDADIKACINQYRAQGTVDRTVFENAFKEYIGIYPQLFYALQEKTPAEELKKRMDDTAVAFKSRWEELCDQLWIPGTSLGYEGVRSEIAESLRDSACLNEYSKRMAKAIVFPGEMIQSVRQKMHDETERKQELDAAFKEVTSGIKEVVKTAGGIAAVKGTFGSSDSSSGGSDRPTLNSCSSSCPYRLRTPRAQDYSVGRECKFGWDPHYCKEKGGKPLL